MDLAPARRAVGTATAAPLEIFAMLAIAAAAALLGRSIAWLVLTCASGAGVGACLYWWLVSPTPARQRGPSAAHRPLPAPEAASGARRAAPPPHGISPRHIARARADGVTPLAVGDAVRGARHPGSQSAAVGACALDWVAACRGAVRCRHPDPLSPPRRPAQGTALPLLRRRFACPFEAVAAAYFRKLRDPLPGAQPRLAERLPQRSPRANLAHLMAQTRGRRRWCPLQSPPWAGTRATAVRYCAAAFTFGAFLATGQSQGVPALPWLHAHVFRYISMHICASVRVAA